MIRLFSFVFLGLMLSTTPLIGQEIIFSRDPAFDTSEVKRGPNRKHYTQTILSYGTLADRGEAGAQSFIGFPARFSLGWRYKRRLSQTFAIGYNAEAISSRFRIQQKLGKIVPSTAFFDRERMAFYSGRLSPYLRINFGRRGNHIGKFIDLGAYAEYIFGHAVTAHTTNNQGIRLKVRSVGYSYYNPFQYGLMAKAGKGRLNVFCDYRLSEIFYPSKQLPELARITAGIQLSFN